MDTDGLVLALDVGGTKIMCGIVDRNGKILCSEKIPSDHSGGPLIFLKRLAELAQKVARGADIKLEHISAVGMTAPGLVDVQQGILRFDPNTGWKDVPFGLVVGDQLGLPVFVDNDVNACATAEMTFGVAKGVSDFVWMTISTGVGGAIVARGHVYYGSSGVAGEFGHLVVEENGPICGCGGVGCLEALASGPSIVRRARAAYSLAESSKKVPETAQELAELAQAGDELAMQIWSDTGKYLARGIASVVNICNPSMVVLGGGVSLSSHLFLPSLKETLRQRVIGEANKSVEIVTTGLGYEAGLMGAAAIALTNILV